MVASFVRLIAALSRTIPVFQKKNWSELTVPGNLAYSPWFKPLLVSELIGEICLMGFVVTVIFYYFRRRIIAPRLVSLFLFATTSFIAVDNIVVNRMPGDLVSVSEFLFWLFICSLWAGLFASSNDFKKQFIR